MQSLLTFALVIITVADPAVQKTIEVLKNEGIGEPVLNQHTRVRRDGVIVFEGPTSKRGLSNRAGFRSPSPPTPHPCPENQSFCEDVAQYPTELLNIELQKYASSKFLLGHFFVEEGDSDINKFGEGETLCPSSTKIIFPKIAKSTAGEFEFVVNTEQYQQGVKVEVCESAKNGDSSECNIPGTLSMGYSSQCVQRHIKRTLVVLKTNTSTTEGLVLEPFDFPSCCSCSLAPPSVRFGGKIPFSGVNRFGSGIPSDRAVDAIPHRASPETGSTTLSRNNSEVSSVSTS